jgi:hypothetical protein
MKNNVITPIQKVILFQYQNKTPFEKFLFWVQYYIQFIYQWLVFLSKQGANKIQEYSEQNEWARKIKESLEKEGWVVNIKNEKKQRRPKAANEMMEFVEVQYENWEAKIESKMKKENRVSLVNVEEPEEKEKGKWGSENIDDKYYDKEGFEELYTQIVLEPDNSEEQKWKRRVMIVWVPMIGNIMMYYDVFRMAFAYYSDTQGIHYNILNACAMRYVGLFHCMDLFMDEMVSLRFLDSKEKVVEYWKSPLRWINKTVEQFHLENINVDGSEMAVGGEGRENGGGSHRGIYGTSDKKKEEGKGIKLCKEERDKLFAKLKQYRTEYVPENEMKLRNRFIYKGRTRDSCIHVFAKKVPEIKVVPPKVSLDMKASFFSGLLPLKLPKFWEVEEQAILDTEEPVEEDENGENSGEYSEFKEESFETIKMNRKIENNSYLEYKKKMGIK